MNLMFINKFFYNKGGSETAFFSQLEMLRSEGHNIIEFSMKDDKNLQSKYSNYFVENVNYEDRRILKVIGNSLKLIYSFEAKRKLRTLIEDLKKSKDSHAIDLAHLHIFQHQITPSILWELKKHKIPILNTIHDLKVICPNYLMLSNGQVCEKCIGGNFINCLKSRCVKNSLANSLVFTIEAYLHRFIGSYKLVDRFVCPSRFYLERLAQGGIDRRKLVYIPNFIDVQKFEMKSTPDSKYILYFGRLSNEKGIETLIRAFKKLAPDIELKIVGTGNCHSDIKSLIKEYNLCDRVVIEGFKKGDELLDLIKGSAFVVVPSTWYENAPYSVIEAMALGKPIIGSNIGGIPEMVLDGVNGYLCEPGNEDDLCSKISKLWNDKESIVKMGKASREIVEETFSPQAYLKKINEVYKDCLQKERK